MSICCCDLSAGCVHVDFSLVLLVCLCCFCFAYVVVRLSAWLLTVNYYVVDLSALFFSVVVAIGWSMLLLLVCLCCFAYVDVGLSVLLLNVYVVVDFSILLLV